MRTLSIRSIVEEHAEEAAFLWFLRDLATGNPDYKLAELTELDNRLEAHIDGLRIAGEVGMGTSMQGLEDGEAGHIFAASVLALESYDGHKVDWIVDIASRSADGWHGLISALGWVPLGCATTWIDWMIKSKAVQYQRLGIAGHAICRVDPGLVLAQLVHADDLATRIRSLRAVGELKRMDLRDELIEHLQDEEPAARFWASWSAALLGSTHGIESIIDGATTAGQYQRRSLDLAARLVDKDRLRSLLGSLAAQPDSARLAMIGAGASGDPYFIEGLINRMSDLTLARAAGEALSMITGVDLADQQMEMDAPEEIEAGPNDDAGDDDVAMDEDEDLPWPDVQRVENWWQSQAAAFPRGKRFLAGGSINATNCNTLLRIGKQRQRAAAALELAIMHPDELLFETRAPGFVQQRQLQ